MKIRRTKPTMKQQLFLFFMLAAVLVCLIFSAYYFVSEQRVLWNNLERENTKNLQYAIEKIEENAIRVEEFANQICQNGQIRALMLADDPFAPAETMAVASMLDEQFQFVTVTEDILSLYLIGENGLDIRRGKEAALVDRDAVYRAFCSDAFFADGGIACWGSGADNPCRFSQYETVLPYSRRIIDETTGRTAGYLVILLREAVLTNIGDALLGQKNTAFCLVDTTDSYVVRSDGWKRLSAHTEQDLRRMAMNEEHRLRDAPYQFFKRSSSVYDWCIVEAVSTYEFAQQRSILLQAFVVVGALALLLALILASVFAERLVQPIRSMADAVDRIAQGQFDCALPRDSVQEYARLEQGIEQMQGDIRALLDSRVQQEKEKRKAEVRMLRAQINPHFIYNTLNSIKMMAVMQGSRGIQNMTEALGSILRSSLSKAEEQITLREELALLEQYIYIQNIRYKGNIEYEVDVQDESLLDLRLQRFLLQPLIENAILHGIEAAPHHGGTIRLTAWREKREIYISVEDDGAGIPPEILQRLQRHEQVTQGSIGVHNVDERLRMLYGEDCGLSFESEEHVRTCVTVHLREMGESK